MTHVRKRSAVPNIMPATVNVRRSYADCRYGQLHVATAYPSGGGFDERAPLICLHNAGGSSRVFAALLPELGRERSVYALDLPGHGYSDAPNGPLSIADYAGAVVDFITSLRLRTFDLLGVEAGSLIAAEIAASRGPQVRRAVFISLPYPTPAVRQFAPRPEAPAASAAETSLADECQKFVQARGAHWPPAAIQAAFADHIRAGVHEQHARNAIHEYPLAQRLPLVRLPSLVLCPNDEYREQTLRAKSCLTQATLAELSDLGSGAVAIAPLRIAQLTREFLDR